MCVSEGSQARTIESQEKEGGRRKERSCLKRAVRRRTYLPRLNTVYWRLSDGHKLHLLFLFKVSWVAQLLIGTDE
jgi:hypothetical protein